MIKKRKLLSLLTALSITATAFAGLAIPANAETISYFSDDLNSYTETGVSAQGTATQTADLGDMTLVVGARGSGGDNTTSISIETDSTDSTNKYFKIVSGGYATSERGVAITINDDTIPAFEDVEDGSLLELAFDAKYSDSSSTMQIFGVTDSTVTTGGVVFNDPYLSVTNNSQIATGEWLHFSVNVANDKSGYITITDADGELVSAKTFTAVGDSLGKIAFYGAASTVYMDNISVSKVDSAYGDLTVTVATDEDEAIAGATVTIGRAEYTTDSNGQVAVSVPAGSYDLTAEKLGYEATADQGDPAEDTATVTAGDDEKVTLTLNEQVYTPVPTTVTITGGQAVMTAPHSIEKTESAAFDVNVIDQNAIEITDADVVWSISPANDYVSIGTDGVVTVLNGFTADDTHVTDFTVTATVTKNGTSKEATAALAISDYLFYEPGLNGSSYGTTDVASDGTANYISTPIAVGESTITLPDPVTFEKGTAQLLSFKTTVITKNGYTFKRTVTFADSSDTTILSMGYINLDIGDADTATWSSSNSTFATTWGSIPALASWVDVSVLFKTNSTGVTKATLTVGDTVTELGEITATDLSTITLLFGVSNSNTDRNALLKDIIVSEVDVTGVEIDGDTEISTVDGVTVTKDYEVDAMVIGDDETFTWSTDIEGATITPSEDTMSATLTVPDTVTEGGTITLVSSASTEEAPKTATLDVTIEPAEIVSATINGSATLDKTAGSAEYTVTDVTDQFGADITDYVTAVWSLAGGTSANSGAAFDIAAEDAGAAVAIKAVYNEDGTLKSVSTEDVTLIEGTNTITADAGATVMLWDSLSGMKPLAAAQTAAEIATDGESEDSNAEINSETGVVTITGDGDITVTVTFTNNGVDYAFTKDVKIATFSAVEDADGESTVVDISSLAADDAITGYQVTTATADGVQVAQTEVALADVTDGTITANTTGADKVEVAPIYEGVMNKEYLIPSATYNITVTANNGSRTDVYVNDQLIINNLNQGSDSWSVARTIASSTDYEVGDVVIAEGSAKFNYQDDNSGGTTVSAVKFVKAPSIVTRKQRIYVLGDSLVAKYYGTAAEGNEGLVRTGWGDVLSNYIVDDVAVTNLGNSGVTAVGLYGSAYSNVLQSAQEGDIMILESGYNDANYTTLAAMQEAVTAMVEGAVEKGLTVFVVSPNASSHSSSEYSGSVQWSSHMNTLGTELSEKYDSVSLIDLASLSAYYYKSYYGSDLSAEWGDGTVATLLQTYYNNANDKLHSSYNAASCWAAVIANGLLNNETTADVVDTTYKYNFSDGTNDITVSAAQISNPNYTESTDTDTDTDATE